MTETVNLKFQIEKLTTYFDSKDINNFNARTYSNFPNIEEYFNKKRK